MKKINLPPYQKAKRGDIVVSLEISRIDAKKSSRDIWLSDSSMNIEDIFASSYNMFCVDDVVDICLRIRKFNLQSK